jgi:hypothetical protein
VQKGVIYGNYRVWYRPSGRNRSCGPAIPVQRSNQLAVCSILVSFFDSLEYIFN